MRSCLITFFIVVLCGVSYGQEEVRTLDILITKDGSKWKGTILDWNEDNVEFTTLSGLDLTFRKDEILRVRQRLLKEGRVEKVYEFKEEGLYQVTQLAVSSSHSEGGISATWAAGYRFSRPFGVGIGTGFENYEIGRAKRFIPVFAEVRGFLLKKKMSPYYALRTGYGIAIPARDREIDFAQGGIMIAPEIGYRFSGSSGANFTLGLGAKFQKARYEYNLEWNEGRTIDRYWFQRTEFKFGLVF